MRMRSSGAAVRVTLLHCRLLRALYYCVVAFLLATTLTVLASLTARCSIWRGVYEESTREYENIILIPFCVRSREKRGYEGVRERSDALP